jgi:TonB family protein
MRRATEDRIDHVVTACTVLAAHVLLIWIAIQLRAHYGERQSRESTEPVLAMLIEQPRNLSFGSVPIQVRTVDVLHLQRYAPALPDIPLEAAELTISEAPPQAASAPVSLRADAGLAGDAGVASGRSGGGYVPTLLERVVPKYPMRSARLREEGVAGIHIRVEESGRVAEVKVTSSSGSRRLDDAALDAARKWKFARMPKGSAPTGAWVATELRFVLYRFTYSRLDEDATDNVYVEEVKIGAADEAAPGGQEALGRFIAEVWAGGTPGDAAGPSRSEMAKMRAALHEWGEVMSIRFTGSAGGPQWIAYEVDKQRPGFMRPTVEVKWNMFEVHHQHAISEWLIAVDRDGTVWNARASRAPWL